jgi:hypothetical protein
VPNIRPGSARATCDTCYVPNIRPGSARATCDTCYVPNIRTMSHRTCHADGDVSRHDFTVWHCWHFASTPRGMQCGCSWGACVLARTKKCAHCQSLTPARCLLVGAQPADRSRLDQTEVDPALADQIVAEANLAFVLNMRVFEELDVLGGQVGIDHFPRRGRVNIGCCNFHHCTTAPLHHCIIHCTTARLGCFSREMVRSPSIHRRGRRCAPKTHTD